MKQPVKYIYANDGCIQELLFKHLHLIDSMVLYFTAAWLYKETHDLFEFLQQEFSGMEDIPKRKTGYNNFTGTQVSYILHKLYGNKRDRLNMISSKLLGLSIYDILEIFMSLQL